MRSQDKECLINISNIQYVYKNNMHGLGTYYDNLKILGEYKSKERALEVLDEIQEAKLGNFYHRYPSNVEVSSKEDTIIYNMPEE